MNFLELVKRLAIETGTELEAKVTSVDVPPATAYGETTEHRSRLVRWIQQAWLEIQEEQDQWNFMVQRGRMPLVRGQLSYDIKALVDADMEEDIFDEIVPFVAPVDRRYIWIMSDTNEVVTRQHAYYVKPEMFFGDRDRYNDRVFGVPFRWSIRRNGCIEFDSAPSTDEYMIEFDFRAVPQKLEADDDIPKGLPGHYHMLIVYYAMAFMAGFDETDKQLSRGMYLYRSMRNKVRLRYMREYSLPGTRG